MNLKEWYNPDSLICKSVSIGAFIKVLHFIYVKLFITDFNKKPELLFDLNTKQLERYLQGIEKIDFSKTGPFGRSSSGGQLNKLKEKIVEKIQLFDYANYDDFIKDYKENYLSQFQNWLKEYVL